MLKKILIIDDEVDVLKILVYRLKARGYDVLTAINGTQGIEVAMANKLDLIILDYHLPDIDAKTIASRIRATQGNDSTRVILATASVEGIPQKAEACGANDYMTKPISPEILYAKVEKQLYYGDLK